jgi:hypothetical protein
MHGLSQRLVRFALLASATSLFSYAGPVAAQLPVFRAERAGEPEPSPPAAPSAPASTAATAPLLPPAPPPPVGAAPPAAPVLDSASAPAPAKAALITDPGAHRAAEARAERERDSDESAGAELESGRRWYGWETLTADGVSLAAFLAGVSISSGSSSGNGTGQALAWFGLLGYELAPGVVHFAHRNPGRAFASFGMRLGLPLAGAFIGASLASGCDANLCEAGGAGAGILIGMGAAVAIDAAVFAYDDATHSPARRLGFVPLVAVAPHQAWFGIGGDL